MLCNLSLYRNYFNRPRYSDIENAKYIVEHLLKRPITRTDTEFVSRDAGRRNIETNIDRFSRSSKSASSHSNSKLIQ